MYDNSAQKEKSSCVHIFYIFFVCLDSEAYRRYMRELEKVSALSTSDLNSLPVPRLPGLTRTNSSPLPLQVLHQQSLLLLQRQEEERLRSRNSRDYVKQVSIIYFQSLLFLERDRTALKSLCYGAKI